MRAQAPQQNRSTAAHSRKGEGARRRGDLRRRCRCSSPANQWPPPLGSRERKRRELRLGGRRRDSSGRAPPPPPSGRRRRSWRRRRFGGQKGREEKKWFRVWGSRPATPVLPGRNRRSTIRFHPTALSDARGFGPDEAQGGTQPGRIPGPGAGCGLGAGERAAHSRAVGRWLARWASEHSNKVQQIFNIFFHMHFE